MFKATTLFVCFVAACNAATTSPATPPATPNVYCGEVPNQIYACVKLPKLIGDQLTGKCERSDNPCDRISCTFREAGWLVDGKVDKKKVSAHFDQFGVDHPEWAPAVQHTKAACLDRDLPAQGVYLDCPVYDIMWCSFASFIRSAQPSQWPSTATCMASRQYAGACPVCPSECFAPAVPIGSCNACLSLPRSP